MTKLKLASLFAFSVRKAILLVVIALAAAGCANLTDRTSSVGSAGKDLVSGAKYANLLVEIDYPQGYEPNADAVTALKDALVGISDRDAGNIRIVQDASIPAESKQYSFSEIQSLENAHRDHHSQGDTAALYVIYVAGGSDQDTGNGKVLGAAYHGTSIVMFKGNIKANTGGGPLSTRPQEQYVERAVLIHELGHAAGLVNLGAPMVRNHEDPAHPGHSSNSADVMYWALDTSGGIAGLVNCSLREDCGIPYTYDREDRADLDALRSS